jgi:type VI secretion system protein ImpH
MSMLQYNQVHKVQKIDDCWHIILNLTGLVGPLGVLPLMDQQLVSSLDTNIKESNSAFFDIFHHELTMRSYESWLAHRILLTYQKRNHLQVKTPTDRTLHSLLIHLAGSLSNRTSIDDFMVSHALIFRKKYISTSSLEALLRSYFGFELRVQNFSPNFHCISEKNFSRLSKMAHQNSLGQDVRLGQSIVVYQNQIRIDIGPLNWNDYQMCLPGGEGLLHLKKMIEKIVPHHIEVRAKLVIKQSALPRFVLSPNCQQLGRTAWLCAKPITQDKEGCSFSVC